MFGNNGLIRRLVQNPQYHSPLSAGGWATTSYAISYALGALLFIPLARLLDENAFGLYTEATLIYSALVVMLELSLVRALVRATGDRGELAQATLWISLIGGLLGAVLCALAGIPASTIFGEERLGLILLLFAPGVLASSLGTVPHALLSRDLDFRRRLLPETISVGIAAVVALVAAFAKAGVYSLVIYQLLRVTLNTVIAWMVVRWRPTAKRPDRKTVGQILSYALPLTGAELMLYARFNLDYAIGGVRLGTSALGVYTLAWNTADRPALLINSFFDKVGFATFARLRLQAENRARLVQMYLTATRLLMALTIPLFLGAALVREELVATVFGGKWQGMVEPLLPLFILQMLWVIFYPSSSMVLALGHSRVYAIVNALSLGLSLTAILIGTSNGITGLSWGMLVASGATSLTWGALACWYLRPGLSEVAEALKMPLLFTLTTLPATVLTHWLAGSLHLPAMVRFGAAVLVAVVVFGAMARLCWPALKQDFHLLREKLPEEAEPALRTELDSAEEEAVVELKG